MNGYVTGSNLVAALVPALYGGCRVPTGGSHDRSPMNRASVSRHPMEIRRKPTLSPPSSQRRVQYFSA